MDVSFWQFAQPSFEKSRSPTLLRSCLGEVVNSEVNVIKTPPHNRLVTARDL